MGSPVTAVKVGIKCETFNITHYSEQVITRANTTLQLYSLLYLSCSILSAVQVVVGLVQGCSCFLYGLLSHIQRLLGVVSYILHSLCSAPAQCHQK